MNPKALTLLFGCLCACFGPLLTATADVTKFTYQGRLIDQGNPAAGNFDMQFTLRDAVTNGNAVGGPVTRAPVEVTNGLFTVTLDFGSAVFNGTARWLEIGVRTNGSIAGYALLSPAQLLAAAPYAITAQNLNGRLNDSSLAGNYTNGVRMTNIFNQFAGSFRGNGANLSNLDSRSLTGTLTVDAFGHVAVGTNDSGAALQVAGGSQYVSPQLLSVITNNSMGLTNLSSPVNVFLVRTTAYVTVYSPGSLEILDVSDPQHPRVLGEAVDHALKSSSPFALAGASGLFVSNNIAYVTAETGNNLNIIDVSNPQIPVKLAILTNGFGGFTNLNTPTDVLVKGTNCFVLGFFSSALNVIDVSNPSSPRLLNQIVDATIATNSPFTKMAWPYKMCLSRTNLYIAGRQANAVTILDVSVPANPRLLAEVADVSVDPSSPFTQLKGANWVDVVGNTAYIASGAFNSAAGSLTIMDVSDPRHPTKLSEVADASIQPGSPFTKLKGAWAVRVSQNTAFVTSVFGNAVTIIDVSDPANPSLITELVNGVGGFNYLNFTEGLTISGDTLCVIGDGSSALNFIGIHSQLGLEVDQFVGIGTATPRTALDVAGIITAQGLNVAGAVTAQSLNVAGAVSAQSLNAAGPVQASGPGSFASLSAQGSVLVDQAGVNNGAYAPGVSFGIASGETIASKRTVGGNLYGLDFYTAFQPRMSIGNSGNVGIGTTAPAYTLDVNGDIHTPGNAWVQGWYYCLFGGVYYRINKDASGNALWQSSDARLKEQVATIPDAVSTLKKLRGVSYHWNETGLKHLTRDIEANWKSPSGKLEDDQKLWESKRKEAYEKLSKEQTGFIAQEVEQVFPDWVTTDEQGYKRINMEHLNAVMLNAIKEQQDQIDSQQRRLTALEQEREANLQVLKKKTEETDQLAQRVSALEKWLRHLASAQNTGDK